MPPPTTSAHTPKTQPFRNLSAAPYEHSVILAAVKRVDLNEPFHSLLTSGAKIARHLSAEALMVLADLPYDFKVIKERVDGCRLLVAADDREVISAAKSDGITVLQLDDEPEARRQQLSQAVLEGIAREFLKPGDRVVALYPAVEAREIDTLTIISLSEHLERLTARDLQRLQTQVPLDTLRQVVNLAIEIGRDGREGKRVGTLLVVGHHRKVLTMSHEQVHDPFRGYSARERQILDARVRESVKEIAQLDGAFIISADGTVMSAGRNIDAPATGINISKGLGSRHWAAAAISKVTNAIAVAVSESTGTVRIFQDGKVVLRIEPMGRPMKWRDFDHTAESPMDG
jgi:diadenylate cyclase